MEEELTRRDLLRRGLLAIGTLTVISCGGGGAGLGSTKRSVLARTIDQYGVASVAADPDNPEYLIRVGALAPENSNQGLIFQINGRFPPDADGNINSAQTFMTDDSDTITWLLVTRR